MSPRSTSAAGSCCSARRCRRRARLVDGISHGVDKAGARFADAGLFLHGSTIAINTMLERSGARTALLTTEGFRDSYEIGRINRPDSYNLFFRKHVPLVERALRFEVRERITADGEVLVPLDETQVNGLCDQLEAASVEAVAILLLHCYVNPEHEERVKRIVQQRAAARLRHRLARAVAGISRVRALLDHGRERLHRSARAAATSLISTRISRSRGSSGAFLLVQSTGGLYQSRQAQTECVRMLESGPAAGVVGAQALCRELKLEDAVGVRHGRYHRQGGRDLRRRGADRPTALVGGYNEALPIQIPMVACLRSRHRRRQHRRGRRERRAARRAAERRRGARPGVLRARRHAAHRHRCQPRARPAGAPTASSAAR